MTAAQAMSPSPETDAAQVSPDREKWLEKHWAEVAQIEQALEKASPGSLAAIEALRLELARMEQSADGRAERI